MWRDSSLWQPADDWVVTVRKIWTNFSGFHPAAAAPSSPARTHRQGYRACALPAGHPPSGKLYAIWWGPIIWSVSKGKLSVFPTAIFTCKHSNTATVQRTARNIRYTYQNINLPLEKVWSQSWLMMRTDAVTWDKGGTGQCRMSKSDTEALSGTNILSVMVLITQTRHWIFKMGENIFV